MFNTSFYAFLKYITGSADVYLLENSWIRGDYNSRQVEHACHALAHPC